MVEERTLLQQIRDKEQAFSIEIEKVKQEADVQIASAEREREAALHQAEISGKKSAEEQYRKEQQKTVTEIQRMKEIAETEASTTLQKGKNNLRKAVDKIVRYVTME